MNTLNTTPSTNGSKSVLDGKNGRNKLDNRFDRRQLMRSSNRLERMAALRRNMYDIDYEKDIILDTQKCQRNYDLSKKIEPEYRDYFLWLAANAPSKQHEGYFSNDVEVGQWTFWYYNGNKRMEGNFRYGEFHGDWAFYTPDGKIAFIANYKNGRLIDRRHSTGE